MRVGPTLVLCLATAASGADRFPAPVISDISKDSWRLEQAFSDDGGRTSEVNWIATDTRLPERAAH